MRNVPRKGQAGCSRAARQSPPEVGHWAGSRGRTIGCTLIQRWLRRPRGMRAPRAIRADMSVKPSGAIRYVGECVVSCSAGRWTNATGPRGPYGGPVRFTGARTCAPPRRSPPPPACPRAPKARTPARPAGRRGCGAAPPPPPLPLAGCGCGGGGRGGAAAAGAVESPSAGMMTFLR